MSPTTVLILSFFFSLVLAILVAFACAIGLQDIRDRLTKLEATRSPEATSSSTVKRYEYIWLRVDLGDIQHLNRYSQVGWRVVYCEPRITTDLEPESHIALLEREIWS